MKKIVCLLLTLCVSFSLTAGELWVYAINGKAWKQVPGGWEELHRADHLTAQDVIRTAPESCMTILDRSGNVLIPVQNTKAVTVQSLLAKKKATGLSLVKEYVNYLMLALKGQLSEEQQAAGVVYRGEDDDAILTASCPMIIELLRLDDKRVAGNRIVEGESYMFRLTNLGTRPLFVNVVDIDGKGVVCECLELYSLADAPDLFIPAGASVMLGTYPVSFSPAGSSDLLVPVASEKPFLLRKVLANGSQNALASLRQGGRHELRIQIVKP